MPGLIGKGITLIEVPYWWDKKISSLAATVYNQRPELFKEKPLGTPIPFNPPSDTFDSGISTYKILLMNSYLSKNEVNDSH